jgi:hypothetical protein
MNAWMKVTMTTVSGMLLYYKTARNFDEQPTIERLRPLAATTGSVDAAIDDWLSGFGKAFLETGEASVAGNPPPHFTQDFCNYLEEFVKRSLRLSQSPSRARRNIRTSQVAGDEEPILTPDRFQEHFAVACVDLSRPYKSPAVTKATILKKAHFSAFSPVTITPDSEFILEIWTCHESHSEYAELYRRATRRKTISDVGHKEAVTVALGTWLCVSVSVPAFGIDSLEDRRYWNGDTTT